MKAEIISIGTELLLGRIVNTNAPFISQRLAEIGIDVYFQISTGDNPHRLADTFREALKRSDIVISSGGLGPTVDDVTAQAVSTVTNRKLILDKPTLRKIQALFRARNWQMSDGNERQAYVPKGSTIIPNNNGTAPGMIVKMNEKLIICLPGPPREMEPMMIGRVLPYLKKLSGRHSVLRSRTIKIANMSESSVNSIVKDMLELKPPTTVGIYAKLREVNLVIMSKASSAKKADSNIRPIEKIIRCRLGEKVFGVDKETLEGSVIGKLTKKGLKIAVAESCTGGLLANRLTNVSGSSKPFMMGVVSYANEAKVKLLGVSKRSLEKYGAVSKVVASQMADGIRKRSGADVGVGITGIAGPSGGTKIKPVGLVFVAIARKKDILVEELRLRGTREDIKYQTTQAALDLIRRNI